MLLELSSWCRNLSVPGGRAFDDLFLLRRTLWIAALTSLSNSGRVCSGKPNSSLSKAAI